MSAITILGRRSLPGDYFSQLPEGCEVIATFPTDDVNPTDKLLESLLVDLRGDVGHPMSFVSTLATGVFPDLSGFGVMGVEGKMIMVTVRTPSDSSGHMAKYLTRLDRFLTDPQTVAELLAEQYLSKRSAY